MAALTSAALTEAERTIEKLRDENSRMKNELHEMKSLYSQLIQESERESLDERRVLLLKSQLIQTERQLLLMNEAISSRANVQLEMEIAMLDIADRWRKYIGIDNKSPNVAIPRSELIKQVEQAESVRLKLTKCIENSSIEKLAKPLLIIDKFVKEKKDEDITLFEVCSGRLDHLNLKHISKLENDLSELYHHLLNLEHSLGKNLVKMYHHDPRIHIPVAEMERQYLMTQTAVDRIQFCCEKLLNLSILIPAAPHPAFKSKFRGVSIEKVISCLPTTVKTKSDTKQVIEALMNSLNYSIHMKSLEIDALKDELKFHQSIYEQQCQYMDDLFQAMKVGYGQFESSVVDCLIMPLEDIFDRYEVLQADASEEALRKFLTTFKSHADDLQSAVEKMKPDASEQRTEALSAFGEQFFANLARLQHSCAKKRDDFMANFEIVKQQREKYSEQLEILLRTRQIVHSKSKAKLEYERLIASGDHEDASHDGDPSQKSKKSVKPYQPYPKTISHECIGCQEDEHCTENGEPSPKHSKEPARPTSSLDENSIESRKPPTPITGSNIPRTPSSRIRTRRPSTESKKNWDQSPSTAATQVPIRNLKLKK